MWLKYSFFKKKKKIQELNFFKKNLKFEINFSNILYGHIAGQLAMWQINHVPICMFWGEGDPARLSFVLNLCLFSIF
jgi:hypothetical protein